MRSDQVNSGLTSQVLVLPKNKEYIPSLMSSSCKFWSDDGSCRGGFLACLVFWCLEGFFFLFHRDVGPDDPLRCLPT